MTPQQKIGLAVVAVGGLLLWSRRAGAASDLPALSGEDLDALRRALPEPARGHAPAILAASVATKISPFLIVGIGSRESQWGASASLRPPRGGPGAVGDGSRRYYAGSMLESALAVGARETGQTKTNQSGTQSRELDPPALGPSGERGWGMGLMQLDALSYPDFVRSGAWRDPATNVLEGAKRLKQAIDFMRRRPDPAKPLRVLKGLRDPRPLAGDALVLAALASYNSGEGDVLHTLASGATADSTTAGGDYGSDVTRRAREVLVAFRAAGGDEAVA